MLLFRKNRGQKPIMNVSEVIAVSKNFLEKGGKVISSTDIEKLLKEKQIEKETELGYSGKILDEPTSRTCWNYQKAFASINHTLGIREIIQQKTDTRFTVEQSLISTMAYICVVAVSNFKIGGTDSRYKNIKSATDGS